MNDYSSIESIIPIQDKVKEKYNTNASKIKSIKIIELKRYKGTKIKVNDLNIIMKLSIIVAVSYKLLLLCTKIATKIKWKETRICSIREY